MPDYYMDSEHASPAKIRWIILKSVCKIRSQLTEYYDSHLEK